MRRFNVEITVINPSWHATRCALPPKDKLLESFRAAPPEVQADYGEEYVLEAADEAYNGRQWFTWNVRGGRGTWGERREAVSRPALKPSRSSCPRFCQVLTFFFLISSPCFLHSRNEQPENVGRVMLWAVTAEKYRPQYLVGMDARFINMPFLALPRR